MPIKRMKPPLVIECGEVRCYYAGKCICPPEHVEPENRATQELPAVPDAQLPPKTWTAAQERDAIVEFVRKYAMTRPWSGDGVRQTLNQVAAEIADSKHLLTVKQSRPAR